MKPEILTIISLILNAILSVSFITTIVTLRETKRKAQAEVEAAKTTNANSILETNQKYIVEPLKKEINALRKTVNQLTRAINRITDCPHAVDCPVRSELQRQQDSEQ